MNKNKAIFMFLHPGECWHTVARRFPHSPTHYCTKCGMGAHIASPHLNNPDYSLDPDFLPMVRTFMEHEGWQTFTDRIYSRSPLPDKRDAYYVWLLSSNQRFVDLMVEWLGLEETREKFGNRICLHCKGNGKCPEGCIDHGMNCRICDGTGRIFKEWAKEGR